MSMSELEQAPPVTKAGLAVRGFPDQVDDEFLNLYFGRFGEIQHIHFLDDQKLAYVEYTDPSVISGIVSKSHTIRKCLITVEEVDLLEIMQPYLIVKGFPPFVTDEILTQHFKAAADNAEVESVQLRGSEAAVFYVDSKVALQVASKKQVVFGAELTVEVGYSLPKPQEECALIVKGLPLIPALNPALEYYFKQQGHEVIFCEIVDQVAYLKFNDPTVVQKIVSQPPTQEFLAGVKLQMESIPVSEIPVSDIPISEIPLPEILSPEVPAAMKQQSGGIDITKIHGQYQQQQAAVHGPIPPQGHPSGQRPPSPYGSPPDRGMQYPSTWASPGGQPTPVPHPQPGIWATPVSRAHRGPSPVPGQQNQETSGLHPNPFGDKQFFVEDLDSPYPQRYPSSQQPQQPPPSILAGGVIPNQVIVEGFPQDTQEFVLQLYLGSLCQTNQCTKVKTYGNAAVATFSAPVDFNSLVQKSRMSPFPQGQVILSFSPMKPPDTVVVSNLPENTQEFVLELYFNSCAPVERVKLVSPNEALVTFKNHQSVQPILSQQHALGTTPIRVQEYQPLSGPSTGDQVNELSNPQPQLNISSPQAKHMWVPLKRKISPEKQHYLFSTLSKFNAELEDAKAHASIEEDRSDGVIMTIKPEQGASELTDWEDRVGGILSDHLASFKDSKSTFPTVAKGEVLEYTINLRNDHPELYVKTEGENTLVLAGSKELVDEVLERVSEICETFRVVNTSFTLPRKHIKYLMQFCKRDLDTLAGVEYTADSENQVIEVRANPKNVKAFQDLIGEKTRLIQEKSMILSVDAHVLLSSSRGKERIVTTIGTNISSLIYDFEVTSTGAHQLCVLSPTEELCQRAIDTLSHCVQQKEIPVPQTKVKVCNTPEWKQLEKKLKGEFFIQISVMTESIVITGESIAVAGVATKISEFIQEQTSVRDHVVCQTSEWRVIRENKFKELTAVKDCAKKMNVDVEFPETKVDTDTVKILIRGDHTAVYDVKVQIEMLGSSVQEKVTRISRVPGLIQILKSLEDKLRVLEQTHKVVIEVDIESEDNGTTESAKSVGESSMKVCIATAPDGSKVTVFTGDFTQNHAGTLVNFVTPDRNYSQGTVMALINAGGRVVQDDLHSKMSQFLVLNPGQTFKSSQGQLKCTQLLHCIVPPWVGGDKNESYFLEEALKHAFRSCTQYGTLLITPVTTQPFSYPVNVFAEKFIDVVSNSYDVQVMVFAENVSHAKAFEESLKAKNFQILSQRGSSSSAVTPQTGKPDAAAASVISAKAISGQISSFIFLSQGDMFQQAADVYINSTNKDLDLSQGQVSKLFLKACGKQLQEQCKEYAPLGPGAVAVTPAKNLKCKYIFHVSLPSHSSVGSERVFRETVQNVLKAAQTQGASSIVIPSLGVAGLNYPASISAKILFEEVITFHIRNPSSIQKFYFVIYEKTVHQEFGKVYAQHMSQPLASGQDISQATRSFSSVRTVTPARARSSSGDQVSSSQQSTRLYVVQENIVNESTDAIVNTTTEDMNLSTGGVSKAIARKAGPKLQMVCKQLVDNGLKLEQGNIAVTSACGQLRCKKVIHAHLPHGPAASHTSISPQQMVEKIVTACVEKAEEECLRSISFPAFGIGAAGYSVASMAEAMLKVLKRFGQTKPKSVETIRIVILDQKLHQEFFEFFCTFFNIDITSQGSQGIFHSIGASLKASLGFRGKDDIYVELQPGGSKHPGALSVRVPGSQVAVDISPRALPNPVAVFKIYAASMNTADKIEQEIRKNVKERVADEKIEEKYIGYLIDDDIQEIESIGNDQGVVIKVMPKIKQITISGEQRRVSHVQMKVTNLLREVEKAHTELQIFEWQSQDGETFESYPPEANIRLERALKKGIPAIQMTIDDVEVVIDLKNFQEMSRATGSTRTVQRVRKMQIDYPAIWEEQPKEGGRAKASHMFDVPASSPEYQDAIKEFEATIQSTKCTIVKVQRIQNPNEYARHCAFRDTLQHKHGKKAEERRLFHGTKTDSVDAIAHQAFNRIFASDANAAVFGKGVYFAVNASYSAQRQYAVPDSSGQQCIFVCNVVIGAYTKGSRDMKIAPHLPNNPHVLYDTLASDEKNPTIFVAMSDSQAYPEYLVTFKLN